MCSRDFPFTIMDVAGLLRLKIRRRSPSGVYVDCPFCGDHRGKMNLNLEKNVWRCNYCNESGGMLALYAKAYSISNSEAFREICDALQTEGFAPEYSVPQKESTKTAEKASVREIHQTYAMLLSMLSLLPAHREHLRIERGLTNEQIDQYGFKSTPPPYLCRSFAERLQKQGCTLQGVPGFYQDDYGRWTIKFYQRTAGILIPIRGLDGLIHGMQIRLDHPIKEPDDPPEKSGTKYLWLSSAGKNMGTTSGSPVHFIGDPCARVVYVIEGGLKAYICHALMNRTFVATAGANNVSQLDDVFAFLHRNGTEEVIEAADMDKYRNAMVEQGASKIYAMAKKHGLKCRRLTWNPNYKGMDDWQLAVRRKNLDIKEVPSMKFKQQYLWGLCSIQQIDAFVEHWHQLPEDSVTLPDYLGLTAQEYHAYLKDDDPAALQRLLDSQRRYQQYRIYQLDFEQTRTIPFAFSGISALQKAGFEQPPASEYRLIYESGLYCPQQETADVVLEQIYQYLNDHLPKDYHGRSLTASDIVELHENGNRTYFYCDTVGFVPVKFSPMLAKPMKQHG